MLPVTNPAFQSNFDLKKVEVELVRTTHRADRAVMAIKDLEALRTRRDPVSASKYGLETICGGSCETGAQ